jgi:hypothetical protein
MNSRTKPTRYVVKQRRAILCVVSRVRWSSCSLCVGVAPERQPPTVFSPEPPTPSSFVPIASLPAGDPHYFPSAGALAAFLYLFIHKL